MTERMKWIGLFATLVIVVIIPVYSFREPTRQVEILEDYRIQAVISATDMYAENCAVCHGADGAGIGDNPALNSEAVRMMSSTDLEKVIERGRYNTMMAPLAVEEGGVLSSAKIQDLSTLIQHGSWEYVKQRVADLGLTPPEVIALEISDDMLAAINLLPEGDVLGEGMFVYAEQCAACHNSNGAGTSIAPALDSTEVRSKPQEELVDIISKGVPGTLMAGWNNKLDYEQIDSVVKIIYKWPELIQVGVEFPEVNTVNLPASPEMIAEGNRLFDIACKSCHGLGAYGTPMAPALNNQLFLSNTPDAAIYQITAGGVPGTRMPSWGSRLSDLDIQSLVAYLRSLETSAPPILPPIGNP